MYEKTVSHYLCKIYYPNHLQNNIFKTILLRSCETSCTSAREEHLALYPSLPLSLWLYSPLHFGCLLSLLILYTVGRTPWTGDQPVAKSIPRQNSTIKNKRAQTSIPRVGFEPTTPAFERAKRIHTLEHAATAIGVLHQLSEIMKTSLSANINQVTLDEIGRICLAHIGGKKYIQKCGRKSWGEGIVLKT
jgi:hypothetical protein